MIRTGPTPAEIFQILTTSEHLPSRVDREGNDLPTTDAERLASHARIVEVAQDPTNVRTFCVGCQQDIPLASAALCECGGMVCPACQERETDGECPHPERDAGEVMHEFHRLIAQRGEDEAEAEAETIAQRWESFRETVIPQIVGGEELRALQSVFYGGAFSALSAISAAMELPRPQRHERLTAIRRELIDWIKREEDTPPETDDDQTTPATH